jgi:hypothetical protein
MERISSFIARHLIIVFLFSIVVPDDVLADSTVAHRFDVGNPEEWVDSIIRYKDEAIKQRVLDLHDRRRAYQHLHRQRRQLEFPLSPIRQVGSKLLHSEVTSSNSSNKWYLWPSMDDWDDEDDKSHGEDATQSQFKSYSISNDTKFVHIRHVYRNTTFVPPGSIAARLRRRHLSAISLHPYVQEVEIDHRRYLLQSATEEVASWGLGIIQGDDPDGVIPIPSAASNGQACTMSETIKICLIDSGVFISHPDLPYDEATGNVIGEEFSLPPGQYWNNPADRHGTFVAGIIGASGGNGQGVVGVNPDSRGLCLLVARAFADDSGSGAYQSSINSAMEWWYVFVFVVVSGFFFHFQHH